ncbi:MAG: glycosyltransferase family 2 protein [Acidobacteriaceae bacterium]
MHLHVNEFWRGIIRTVSWLIALAWVLRTYDLIYLLPVMPNLTMLDWDTLPAGLPTLTVVVPARDEAETIGATIEALMVADYAALQVLVVDDRSTDGTAAIVDRYVEEYAVRRPGTLHAIHVSELPEGWLGKTFALMVATENSASDYLLFTDADVLFSPSVLRRALVYAEDSAADHLVVMPTVQVKSRGEGIVLGFLQVMGVWASRPWRVEDPKARRDVTGVGAFNMVRRDALSEIGGWLPQRLAVVEDVTLGRRMKAAGMQQRMVFAPGMVLVHWAKGARGLLRNMTKNLFSAFNFQPLLVLLVWLWIGVFCLLPLVGLGWLGTLLPALVILCCIGATYRVMGAVSLIDARYGWLYPLGAVGMMFAMLRSMVVVTVQRGVVWRGTHYPLRDLRKHNSPFVWEREARKKRDEEIRATRVAKRLAEREKKKAGGKT